MAWPSAEPRIVAERWEDVARVRAELAALAKAVVEFEPVWMAVNREDLDDARKLLDPRIATADVPVDDLWARDTAPTFALSEGSPLAVAWTFNAWGGKQSRFVRDAAFGSAVAAKLGLRLRRETLVCEGGALASDGEGTLMTTESCVLNKNRNPKLSKAEVETRLKDALGATAVIWLPGRVLEALTDGHVDGIAAFVKPGVVVAERVFDSDEPDYAENVENLRALRAAKDAAGRSLEIVELPRPARQQAWKDDFCSTYINFYLPNGGVLLPSFDDRDADDSARKVFAKLFPARKIVSFPLRAIAEGGGGIHCVTQEVPAPSNPASRSTPSGSR